MSKTKNKKAFTHLVKHFRSNLLTALLRSRQSRFNRQVGTIFRKVRPAVSPTADLSQTKFRNCVAHSYGFTLAETLIVLVILGVIASITIPPMVRRQIEAANRTKIKKAMKIYDLVVNNMTTETGIRDINSLQHYAEDNDCEKGSSYFSIAEGSGCVFKTKDGIWWDITYIDRVIIALKKEDLNTKTADSDTNRAFYLLSWFDNNGNLRIDDLAAALDGDKDIISKVYDYISAKTQTSNGTTKSYKRPYTSCDSYGACFTYDSSGNQTASGSYCSGSDISSCSEKYYYTYDRRGNQTAYGYNCSGSDISSCSTKYYYAYGSSGNKTAWGYSCSGSDISSCEYIDNYTITYHD